MLAFLFKFILYLLGWKPITDKQFGLLNEYPRSVVVFSHTSYADFFLMILYLLAYPQQTKNIRMIIKPEPFYYMNYFLRKLGGIPATRVADKNGGSTIKIIEELQQQAQFVLLISPKGTIVKSPWRNGYYHIASKLKCQLMVAGLDYEKKNVIIENGLNYDEEQNKIEQVLKEKLGNIVPLFPEEEIVNIRPHNAKKISIIKYDRMIYLLVIILFTFIISLL